MEAKAKHRGLCGRASVNEVQWALRRDTPGQDTEICGGTKRAFGSQMSQKPEMMGPSH